MNRFDFTVLHGKGIDKCDDNDRYIMYNDNDLICLAVLDGASNCSNSKFGAKEVANFMLNYITTNYDTIALSTDEHNRRMLSIKIVNKLYTIANKHNISIDSLGSTFLFLVIKHDAYMVIHIGDGMALLERDKVINKLSRPANGITKNLTFLTTSKDLYRHVRIVRGQLIKGDKLILMTDGINNINDVGNIINYNKNEYKSSDDFTIVSVKIE